MSFIGKDTALGGSIIMPSDMSRLATTMSITRKGRNTRKPISKARFNSPTKKAGKSTRHATGCASATPGERPRRLAREVLEQGHVGFSRLSRDEGAEGLGRGLEPVHLADPAGHHRLQPLGPTPFEGRLHHEEGQEQRQAHEHRVGRDALRADGRAQEGQHHDDAREGRRHHEQGRGERQQPDQRRELHQARGVARPAGRAEVDADALRRGRSGGRHEDNNGQDGGAHHAASSGTGSQPTGTSPAPPMRRSRSGRRTERAPAAAWGRAAALPALRGGGGREFGRARGRADRAQRDGREQHDSA
jgi:hypothetical protein